MFDLTWFKLLRVREVVERGAPALLKYTNALVLLRTPKEINDKISSRGARLFVTNYAQCLKRLLCHLLAKLTSIKHTFSGAPAIIEVDFSVLSFGHIEEVNMVSYKALFSNLSKRFFKALSLSCTREKPATERAL